jgi:hypothetical protein
LAKLLVDEIGTKLAVSFSFEVSARVQPFMPDANVKFKE